MSWYIPKQIVNNNLSTMSSQHTEVSPLFYILEPAAWKPLGTSDGALVLFGLQLFSHFQATNWRQTIQETWDLVKFPIC